MSSNELRVVLGKLADQLMLIARELVDWPKIAADFNDLEGWDDLAERDTGAIRAAADEVEALVRQVGSPQVVLSARAVVAAVVNELEPDARASGFRLVEAACHYAKLSQAACELRILASAEDVADEPSAVADGDDPNAEWSPPMTRTAMARRILGDENARPRQVQEFLKRYGLQHIAGKMYRIRLERMDKATRARLTSLRQN